MPVASDQGMTIKEVAQAQRKDPKTVWKWIREGLVVGAGERVRLKAAKVGRDWRVDPADLEEFSRRLTESALASK